MLLCGWLACLAPGQAGAGPPARSDAAAASEPAGLDAAIARLRKVSYYRSRKVRFWSVAGKDGWLFMDEELRHVAAGKFWGDAARRAAKGRPAGQRDPLPAILDYRDRLAALGIELILVPVPPKAIIYPDELIDEDIIPLAEGGRMPRLDPDHQAFYALLREEGLTVIDATELFLQHRFGPAGPAYCKQDHHYSGQGIALLAPRIADVIRRQAWYRELQPERRSLQAEREDREIQISGDLWQTYRLKVRKAPAREVLKLEFIGRRDAAGKLEPIATDPHSPVLVFGGSHALVFHAGGDMHAEGAGLVDHLAAALGMPVDLVATRGDMSHNPRISIYRRAKKDPDTITTKKVFVWVFSARAFTVGRWSTRIPVAPAAVKK